MAEEKSLVLLLFLAISIVVILAVGIWLIVQYTRHPTFTITDLSVPISNGNSTSMAGQNGSLSYTLEIKNRNEASPVHYNDILLTFHYNQDIAGKNTIDGFRQGNGKTTKVLVDHVDINATVWRPLQDAIASNKTAQMMVDLWTTIGVPWRRRTVHLGMHLQGRVQIGSDGKISGKKKNVKLVLAVGIWLIVEYNRYPTFTITDLSVPISSNGTSMAGQNGSLSYTLVIKNRNNVSPIHYHDILLRFYYNQDTAGENTIDGFSQGSGKTTKVIIDHVDINATVWMQDAIATNKTAQVMVDLWTTTGVPWRRSTVHQGMHLQGRVEIGSDGKISGKKKTVKLGHRSKK
ncbi:hypothetical protein F0562_018928 [Nyssa sinensis]|uniref:Late embryogenesis abundant protein LEA-2 subgroup domain-containing protein n=1 Tax=Nyssa sinensis TaxID=561372 RepID=A0A5J4ZDT3_9ASTE|nr:hypothetical protein F0562_018928 [Nyssa sinensis]